MQRRIQFLFALAIIVAGLGCFHKDVATDNADDIVGNFVYSGPEGQWIISKESIFQANSKSSGGGVTTISGYTEFRLSSYDFATGNQVARVALGEMMEEANALLGFTPGKIWMWSIQEDLGLHYRDPKTLEVKESWEQLSKKPSLANFKPARPEWPLIDQYFALDPATHKLIITDEAGFRYFLDPETFALTKTDTEIPRIDWDASILSTSGQLIEDKSIYLEGDPRKEISYLDKKSGAEVSFLFGEWLLDMDPIKEAKRQVEKFAAMENALKLLKDSLSRYEAAHPEANQEPNYSTWSYEKRQIHDIAVTLRRDIEDAERDLRNERQFHNKVLDYPLLTSDGKSGYILHANLVADTAHTIISRVNLHPDSTWSVAWSTHLMKFYRNPDKADNAGAFETVYSKGNPEFGYRWAAINGHYLVMIAQLRMACLDTETGKLLWEREM